MASELSKREKNSKQSFVKIIDSVTRDFLKINSANIRRDLSCDGRESDGEKMEEGRRTAKTDCQS